VVRARERTSSIKLSESASVRTVSVGGWCTGDDDDDADVCVTAGWVILTTNALRCCEQDGEANWSCAIFDDLFANEASLVGEFVDTLTADEPAHFEVLFVTRFSFCCWMVGAGRRVGRLLIRFGLGVGTIWDGIRILREFGKLVAAEL